MQNNYDVYGSTFFMPCSPLLSASSQPIICNLTTAAANKYCHYPL